MSHPAQWLLGLLSLTTGLTASSSHGEFFVLSGPAYNRGNLYYTYQTYRDMYCVTDELSSALTWNSNLDWAYKSLDSINEVDAPQVVYSDQYVYPANDTLTCAMSYYEPCTHNWRRVGSWNVTYSLRSPTAPVFDNRWNDFTTEKLSDAFKRMTHASDIGSLSVSIRGASDAHFALCTDAVASSFCFFIVLGGWDNSRAVIRKCEKGVPDPVTNYPKGECNAPIAEVDMALLSATEWRTFAIKWNLRSEVSLTIYSTETKVLEYREKMSDYYAQRFKSHFHSSNYNFYARSKSRTLIKFHYFNYLRSTTTKSKLTSPPILTTSPERTVCLEMSIYQCEKCLLTVDFVDRNGTTKAAGTFHNRSPRNHYDLPAWQTVKIRKRLSAEMHEPITLSINTLLSNNTSRNNTYWAVSNIRRCHDAAIKVSKVRAYQDYNETKAEYFWPRITCQKIAADGSSTVIDSTRRDSTTLNPSLRPLCPEGKMGPSCLASCSQLYEGSHPDCRQLLACDRYGCSCAQGFSLPNCDSSCPASTYGFQCSQRCGNCTDGECSPSTGKCLRGCESSKTRFFVPPYCKIGVGSPPAPSVDVINSTCARIALETPLNYTIIPTRVNFKVESDGTTTDSEPLVVKNDTYHVETFAEQLNPGTRYNVTAVVHAGDRTFIGEPARFTTPCTESVSLNFVTMHNETSITLDNRVDVNVNDSCPHSWYRVQLMSENEKLYDDSTPFPKVFAGLEPAKLYRLTVSSEKIAIVDKSITTMDGVPGWVRSLKAVASTEGEIQVAWQPPDKSNGKVANYTAEIEPIESMGCVDLGLPSYQNSANSEDSKAQRIVVTNTTLREYGASFKNLQPYTRYRVVVYASTSRYAGERAEIRHKTLSLERPTELFSNLRLTDETSRAIAGYLRWDPPEDCTSIAGPIKAAKLYVRRLNATFTGTETTVGYYPLEKSVFHGTESYEAWLYALRYPGSEENPTLFRTLVFRMPDRAPPAARNLEVYEVDGRDSTVSLRWRAPLPPLHGILDQFSIDFCRSNDIHKCSEDSYVAHLNESRCSLWEDLEDSYCKTLPIPVDEDYCVARVRAQNRDVPEASEPAVAKVSRFESMPAAPTELILNVLEATNATCAITWTHPQKSGGRLSHFLVQVNLINSNLKDLPPLRINMAYEITTYRPRYSTLLDLSPSSTFLVSVIPVTWSNQSGASIDRKIAVPSRASFSMERVQPKANDDLTISIVIPEVVYDVGDSRMLVVVQGPKHCDEGQSNNEDLKLLLKTDNSSYYGAAWKAATLTEPELYANKEFRIGDGKVYGGSKNYALCANEYYIVHLILVQDARVLRTGDRRSSRSTLKRAQTSAIQIGEVPRNYVALALAALLLLLLAAALIGLLVLRKRLFGQFLRSDKSDTSPNHSHYQESMALSESVVRLREMPKNLFIVETMQSEGPVPIEEFGSYFEDAYKSGQLRDEYKRFKRMPTMPSTYGSQPEIKPLNRYANLFPYDDTRVILEKLPDQPHSHYINANYITGYASKKRAYIATQGPKSNTVVDFWRMIWQEKVRIVCMMTNLVENCKIKCEQYWPVGGVGERTLYGKVTVLFESEEVHSDYTCRTFEISVGEEARKIEQLHYTAWPDHGVPSNPRSIVAFLDSLHRHAPIPRDPDEPPIVVHCSAGVGRTGTLVVLDVSICRAYFERAVDVFEDVVRARRQRPNMVGNTDQYLLVHLVLVEYLSSRDTCFKCDDAELQKRIAQAKLSSAEQYNRIVGTSWWDEVLGSPPPPQKSMSNRNRAKHRFPESALACNRLYLKRSLLTDEDSDYIAATCVKGLLKQDRQCIATQLPMPTTAADFWRMLAEQNVEFVLVLQTPDLSDSSYCELVPENQGYGSTNYLKIIRQESSGPADSQYYHKEQVLIIDSSEQPSKHQIVTIASYANWPASSASTLPNPRELVKLWKAVDELDVGENPSVIVCSDGVTACGLWLAVSALLRRMTVDNECDVYQAVRPLRRVRKDFFDKPEYLDYLYDVALAWANDDD